MNLIVGAVCNNYDSVMEAHKDDATDAVKEEVEDLEMKIDLILQRLNELKTTRSTDGS